MRKMRKMAQPTVRFVMAKAVEGFYMIGGTLRLVTLILPRYAGSLVSIIVVQCGTWDEWKAKGKGWALVV